MKYSPHPDAGKRAERMVWRGSGRTAIDAVREPLTARHVLVGAAAPVISESAGVDVFGPKQPKKSTETL